MNKIIAILGAVLLLSGCIAYWGSGGLPKGYATQLLESAGEKPSDEVVIERALEAIDGFSNYPNYDKNIKIYSAIKIRSLGDETVTTQKGTSFELKKYIYDRPLEYWLACYEAELAVNIFGKYDKYTKALYFTEGKLNEDEIGTTYYSEASAGDAADILLIDGKPPQPSELENHLCDGKKERFKLIHTAKVRN